MRKSKKEVKLDFGNVGFHGIRHIHQDTSDKDIKEMFIGETYYFKNLPYKCLNVFIK